MTSSSPASCSSSSSSAAGSCLAAGRLARDYCMWAPGRFNTLGAIAVGAYISESTMETMI
eukprot:575437-Alexandrium_andersonii.AAC.1